MSSKCVKCGRAILIDEDRDLWAGTGETPADCDHTVNLDQDRCGFCLEPIADHPGELCHSGTIVELRAELARLRSDQCAGCGGTRTEPGSGDHDTAVHQDNPYTGEPCSACQQGPAEIGHEKPNSHKLSADEGMTFAEWAAITMSSGGHREPSDGRSTMTLVFCGDPGDHDPHVWMSKHPVLCTGADHSPMTVDEVLSRLVGRPSPGPLFYARHRITLPGHYRITLPGDQP
jgi:hypothetical protein